MHVIKRSPGRPRAVPKAPAAAAPAPQPAIIAPAKNQAPTALPQPAGPSVPAHAAQKYYQPAPERQIIDGLLVSRVPHPMIQTAPDAASMEFEEMAIEGVNTDTIKLPQNAVRPAAGPVAAGGGTVPWTSPRKRKPTHSPELASAAPSPVKKGVEITPENQVLKKQKKGVEKGGTGRASEVEKDAQDVQNDSEDETIAQRWVSTGRRNQKLTEKLAENNITSMSPPRPKRAAKEVATAALKKQQKQSPGGKQLGPLPPGFKLGCPKCRYAQNGCGRCRKRAETQIAAAKRDLELQQAASPLPKKGAKGQQLVEAPAAAGRSVSAAKTAKAAPPTTTRRLSAPVAPLHIASGAVDASTSKTAVGPLQGMCFLVSGSGSDAKESKGSVEELIISLGGRVLSDIPDPLALQPSPAARRLSHDLRNPVLPPTVHAVVADKLSRRAKCIYAAIKGIPIVNPAWLKSCKTTKKKVGWKSKNVLLEPQDPPPSPIFAGLRVHLKASDRGLAQGMTKLMQHAGAVITGQPKDSAEHGATCDLVIIGK